MATVLSFAMLIVGLSYLTLVNRMVMETDRHLTFDQAMYAAAARMMDELVYAKVYSPGHDHHMERTGYYGNVEYEGSIEFGGYTEGPYGQNANYIATGISYAFTHSGVTDAYRVYSAYKAETFADYLYITDAETDMVWGETIYFWTPDTLDGKVHTNDHISIMPWYDEPVFKKRVTSSASFIYPPDNNAHFEEGLYLNMPEIYFPDQADEVRGYAGSQYTHGSGHPDSAYWLAFLGEGYKLRLSGNRGSSWHMDFDELPLLPLPPMGAIFVDGKCWISTTAFPDDENSNDGRLNGRVTVASSDTIYIRGKTVYSCWDEVNRIVPPNCNDALGLISEKWVLVSDRLPYHHYGITINAGIAALRGSFSVDGIYSHCGEHQSLLVYGSLAQFHRGIVHRGSCGSGIGYCQKDYKYDDRFRRHPPPHFISIGESRPMYYEEFYSG
jgi:hypothetical protein